MEKLGEKDGKGRRVMVEELVLKGVVEVVVKVVEVIIEEAEMLG